MRILAISDVARWEGYEELVVKHRPQVVTLAGDLTSDGHAAFWTDAFEAIPEYRTAKQAALRRLGITVKYDRDADLDVIWGGSLRDVMSVEYTVKKRFKDTPEFTKARRNLHTNKFYSFLRFAGQRATVLVVKGDHDEDFPGEYKPSRINRIAGCREISGKIVNVEGLTFLGLGFDEAGLRTPLREFVRKYAGSVDVVITHTPHRNVPIVAELKPRLLVRGHYGCGRYLVNGVPSVFTSGCPAVIEMAGPSLPAIHISCRLSESYLAQEYDWISPYPLAAGPLGQPS